VRPHLTDVRPHLTDVRPHITDVRPSLMSLGVYVCCSGKHWSNGNGALRFALLTLRHDPPKMVD